MADKKKPSHIIPGMSYEAYYQQEVTDRLAQAGLFVLNTGDPIVFVDGEKEVLLSEVIADAIVMIKYLRDNRFFPLAERE